MAGRPSKLSDRQKGEVGRRLASGESIRAVAREMKVGEATLRRNFSAQLPKVRELANALATTEAEVEALPISTQVSVRTLADQLKRTSVSLAQAAVSGAATSAKLAQIAEKKAAAMGDDVTEGDLRKLAQLADTGNRAAEVALRLLQANRGTAAAAEVADTLPAEIRIVHVEVNRGR